MESHGQLPTVQQWESALLNQEEAAAKAAKSTQDLFRKMAQELADALQWKARAEEAEQQLALCENRLKQELDLRELYEEEIQKLWRMLDGTEAEKLQESIVELETKLCQVEENRDEYSKCLQREIEVKEQYEQEILNLQDLAWDKAKDKLEEGAENGPKQESELQQLKLSVSRLEDEKTSLMATLQAELDVSREPQVEEIELGNNVSLSQEDVSHDYSIGSSQVHRALPENCLESVVDPDRQAAVLELLQCVNSTDDLLEVEDGDISYLELPDVLLGCEACAVNLSFYNEPRRPAIGTVAPTSDKSVQAAGTDWEEKDILIQHLKLNLDAALKELEMVKSVYGVAV